MFVQASSVHAERLFAGTAQLACTRSSLCVCQVPASRAQPRTFQHGRTLSVSAAASPVVNAAFAELKEGPKLDLAKMEPLGDRVLVKPDEDEKVTAGGLVMSSGATKAIQDAVIGEVLAVGGEVDIAVKTGDKILYSKYSTSDVSVPDGEVTFVAQKSVLATLS